MIIDVAFEFGKAYNVERIDVVKGQKFTLLTDAEKEAKNSWFSNNDPVLKIDQAGTSAKVEALETGKSIILIMNDSFQEQKKITINVVDEITNPVVDLGITAGQPEAK